MSAVKRWALVQGVMVLATDYDALTTALDETKGGMAYRNSLVGRLEAERDALAAECETLRRQVAHVEDQFQIMQIERDQAKALAEANYRALGDALSEVARLRGDAERWKAFTSCARIKFFGWAGYEQKDPYGNSPGNYRHFGAEFWTIHDAPTADKAKAKQILDGFADAAIAAMAKEPRDA